ncbi:MAG: hypothetical protein QMD85_00165 [Candidatus Aenigmarchaeota archaeon]|nr:hypothetical protein [Candidatus Aenigmarchaeota archaeon]MDI6721941.1 hypothetical protein [Candidatus Aenigmarchaeota archaeon]
MGALRIVFIILTVAIAIVIAFVLWGRFVPEAKRAAFTGIFGPGGLFGIVSYGRKKGMSIPFLLAVIGAVVVFVIILLISGGFFSGGGKVSSSLQDQLGDFIIDKLS